MKNLFLNSPIKNELFGDSKESDKKLELTEMQLKTAKQNIFKMICAGCEREFKSMFLYRCFYCGLWFCRACGKIHFNYEGSDK